MKPVLLGIAAVVGGVLAAVLVRVWPPLQNGAAVVVVAVIGYLLVRAIRTITRR